MRKIIFFIRHWESLANAWWITSDPLLISLTEKWYSQAQLVAKWFIDIPDLIVYSPSVRTHETAKPTILRFPTTQSMALPIHEFTFLDPVKCINTTKEDRKQLVEEYWWRNDPFYVDWPGAESFANFVSRVKNFIKQLEEFESIKNVVVFGHGQFFSMTDLLIHKSVLPQTSPEFMKDFFQFTRPHEMKNAQITKLIMSESGKWEKSQTVFIP